MTVEKVPDEVLVMELPAADLGLVFWHLRGLCEVRR
jgi:hypothetical protein